MHFTFLIIKFYYFRQRSTAYIAEIDNSHNSPINTPCIQNLELKNSAEFCSNHHRQTTMKMRQIFIFYSGPCLAATWTLNQTKKYKEATSQFTTTTTTPRLNSSSVVSSDIWRTLLGVITYMGCCLFAEFVGNSFSQRTRRGGVVI